MTARVSTIRIRPSGETSIAPTSKGLNNQFDKAAVRDIALKRDVDRAFKVPLGEAAIDYPSSADRANRYLAFDADGKPVALPAIGGFISPWIFSSRAEAQGSYVPGLVASIGVKAGNRILNYARDNGGTALTTGDGQRWSPADEVVRPDHFGVTVNSPSDQTEQITKLLDWTSAIGRELCWLGGTYRFTSYNCPNLSPRVKWSSQGGRTILRSIKAAPDATSSLSEFAVNFRGATIRQDTVTNNVSAGGARVNLNSTADIVPGETVLVFGSTRMIETDNRGQKRHGFACVASRIVSPTVVELEKAIPIDMAISDITGVTVTAVGASTCTVAGLTAFSRSDVLYRLKFNTVGGVASGVTALPLSFDPATQTYTFDSNSPRPAGLTNGDSITVERLLVCTLASPAIVDIDEGIVFERDPTFNATPGDAGCPLCAPIGS